MPDNSTPCCLCQQADNYHSVECKYWGGGASLSAAPVSFHSVISLHVNLYQNFTAFATNSTVTLPMSQFVLWHINDFAVAETEHNAFPLLFGVSATVTWFRNHWCISIRCNCMLVSLRSIYQTQLSLLSVRDISLVFCLIWEIISCARKWNVSW